MQINFYLMIYIDVFEKPKFWKWQGKNKVMFLTQR